MAASASGIDEQTQMVQFVKIIQRYPDIYDHNMETYRRWTADKAWEKVVETVKNEMELDCSLEELKSKWKGIRSSYNRFKKKYIEEKKKGALFSKKYYLYDSLQFLEPFTKSKGFKRNTSDIPENVFENCDNIDDEQESVTEPDPIWPAVKIKSDPTENNDENNETNSYSDDDQTVDQKKYKKFKKRKREDKDTGNDSQDLQFFKSILPDIAGFTTKEKRKLKIGILKLVDDIENARRKRKRKSESDSSSSSE
ncbi:uncharacterized protein LOC135074160 [Ostrinia nubilalis]|uniref:uncharacterized protein LOC135074160 n=1 Tax=Ostrinia nubilalis TaxID=29057 RepID=UPI0030825866